MSQDFSEMTARQKAGFEGNLAYIDRIEKDINGWLDNEDSEVPLTHFLDDLGSM